MKEAQVQHLRNKLIDERSALVEAQVATLEAGETVELDQARVGRLSRMDAIQVQQMALESARRNAVQLGRVDRALQRIEAGEYGDCFECGEPIDPRRLEVDPAAEMCISCAE